MVYYNDNSKESCSRLATLIRAGLISEGQIDGRSITDVSPEDVQAFIRVHFFAGIAGWEYALQLAGWGSLPVWTGSCPCQPFSCAGKGGGESDKRHLWPEFKRLIGECRPPIVFGEQVASKLGRKWLTGVRLDLEEMGYAVGASDLCAAGVTAPHIRQRLYWGAVRMGVSNSSRSRQIQKPNRPTCEAGPFAFDGLAVTGCPERGQEAQGGNEPNGNNCGWKETASRHGIYRPWDNYRVVFDRHGKARRIPLEPAFFPMAPRLPGRVADLMGIGNSIVPQVAAEFIVAFMHSLTPESR